MIILNALFLILVFAGALSICTAVFCLVLDQSVSKAKPWMYKWGIRFLIIGGGSIIFSLLGYFLTGLIS